VYIAHPFLGASEVVFDSNNLRDHKYTAVGIIHYRPTYTSSELPRISVIYCCISVRPGPPGRAEGEVLSVYITSLAQSSKYSGWVCATASIKTRLVPS
jgi:hypothetical protein